MEKIVDICEKKFSSVAKFSIDNYDLELWYGATLQIIPHRNPIDLSDVMALGIKYHSELEKLDRLGIYIYIAKAHLSSLFNIESLHSWNFKEENTDRLYYQTVSHFA